MKINDVLKSKIPNAYAAKKPKVKIYMVPESPYGVDGEGGHGGGAPAGGAAAGGGGK
jgi:hypothetical protein